jgi:hypothetical protein
VDSDDVIVDLLKLYPEAASVPDEFGKVPFVLALESGKAWTTCLEPLWNAHPGILNSSNQGTLRDLQSVIDGALTSVSSMLRRQTIRNLRHLAPLWPSSQVNDCIIHMITFSRDCGEFASGTSAEDTWGATIQASTLEGVAAVLGNVPPKHLAIPETPQSALELAMDLLSHHVEEVRVGASHLLAESAILLGNSITERILMETVFDMPDECDDTTVSTGISSFVSDYEPSIENLHGRIMACHAILQRQTVELTRSQKKIVKQWMQNDDAMVRKAACVVAGSVLASSNDLKEFRSPFLKCMRATEEKEVHLAVARGLSHAAKTHPNLFLCKNGLAILDGALMLSRTASDVSVQHAFHVFLWWALRMGDENSQAVIQNYMELAEGGNGRIMMNLISKTLCKLDTIREDESNEDDVDGGEYFR